MGFLEGIKNIFVIPPEEDYDDDAVETEEKSEPKRSTYQPEQAAPKKAEPTPRVIGGKQKTVSFNQNQMRVVLVKPERYEDVTSIADLLNEKNTVVLNLETTDKALSRRIVDFLSGATYANHGNMRKVSKGTFLIVPNGVDMMGELMLEDFDEDSSYF